MCFFQLCYMAVNLLASWRLWKVSNGGNCTDSAALATVWGGISLLKAPISLPFFLIKTAVSTSSLRSEI